MRVFRGSAAWRRQARVGAGGEAGVHLRPEPLPAEGCRARPT